MYIMCSFSHFFHISSVSFVCNTFSTNVISLCHNCLVLYVTEACVVSHQVLSHLFIISTLMPGPAKLSSASRDYHTVHLHV